MKSLKFLKLWLILGWTQVCLVILFSLTPSPVEMQDFYGVDKLIHLITYTFVMLWFGLCFIHGRAYLNLGMGLIFMGILLEVIQGTTSYRSMSYFDMASNGLGVLFGWLLARTKLSEALVFLENRLISA